MKIKYLLGLIASLALSGCVTYTSDYANDGYYSSPDDSYSDYGDDYYGDPDVGYDNYANDGYYGNSGNYGQYSYGSGAFSNISISFNFGPSFSHYGYYPSYYGYAQCSPWLAYCYGGHHSGYGWGYPRYYGYNTYHPQPHHNPKPKPKPKPKPPEYRPDFPRLNAGQPALHPRYPIVDRADGPRPRQQQYRPVNTAPLEQAQTQPIANGGSANTPQYPRQQPRQQPNNPQRQTPRARPIQSEEPTNDYARYRQTPRNAPVQQGQAPRNQPINANQQTHGTIVAQQMPQQRAQPQAKPERRERAESKPREQKAERVRDGDEP